MTSAVVCSHLGKTYPSGTAALEDLTLGVTAGESLGLLGENGAGKSTLVRILMGFVHPSAGHIRLLGEDDVRLARPRVGYLPERQTLEPRLTARRYLSYLAELSGLFGSIRNRRVIAALGEVGLEADIDQRLETYSKGMLQRFGLAQALLIDPELLILDEPTDGLDPASRRHIREVLQRLHERGVTLILCSHNLSEVEEVCDSVAILRCGRLVAAGLLTALQADREITEIGLAPGHDVGAVIDGCLLNDSILSVYPNAFRVPTSQQPAVLRALVAADISIHSLRLLRETLEDVYLRVTECSDRQVEVGVEQ